MKHQQQSLWLSVADYQLHLRQLLAEGPVLGPILMLHGAIENGRIFYSPSGKGLGCFLAEQGFVVYCADFAGRGQSRPIISRQFSPDQQQLICQDVPALIEHLYEKYQQKIHVICHSWGGVLAVASMARFPTLATKVQSLVCFGTKRQIQQRSIKKYLQINLLWNRLGPMLCQFYGYLPAKQWRFGADNEPAAYLKDSIRWINSADFIDPKDGFDYSAAGKQLNWPKSWFFAAINDDVLGHPEDVHRFMREAGLQHARYQLLSQANGGSVDYDHISMLTHPLAISDHFQVLSQWLAQDI